jgi:hypothetical protein
MRHYYTGCYVGQVGLVFVVMYNKYTQCICSNDNNDDDDDDDNNDAIYCFPGTF